MSVYERCFEAEVLHELLYSIDAKCMKLGSPEAEKVGEEATELANQLFSPENLTEVGQKEIEEKVARIQERFACLVK